MVDQPARKIERLSGRPFLDGPGEFLCKTVCQMLDATRPFKLAFGDYIDPYMRMDYPLSSAPALRVYNNQFETNSPSWWLDGDVTIDIIWPADLRRVETQALPDMLAAAMVQQFRRLQFFNAVRERVPGLNYLGKTLKVDKNLLFVAPESDTPIPLTQVKIDFRIDLRAWDLYLEETNRTVDDPFEQTLVDLSQFIATIQGLNDDGSVNIELGAIIEPQEE